MVARSKLPFLMLALLALLLPVSDAHAQRRETLRPGNNAPPIQAEKWLNGSPITSFQDGRAYLVVFFDAGRLEDQLFVRVLDDLREQGLFVNIGLVGITTSEEDDVRRILNVSDGVLRELEIPIALDGRKQTTRAWVEAAGVDQGRRGIVMFMVDPRGRIQYIGTPFEERFLQVAPLIIDGRYDERLFRRATTDIRGFDAARKVRNWRLANEHIDNMIELDRTVFALYHIERFEMKLVDQDDREGAYAYARTVMEEYTDDPSLLLQFARYIADNRNIPDDKRDFAVAEEMVAVAKQRLAPSDPLPVSIEALIQFRQGNFQGAVRLQRRAWRMAPEWGKRIFKDDLDRFTQARDGVTGVGR